MSNIFESIYTQLLTDNANLSNVIDNNIIWNVAHPINTLKGIDAVNEHYLARLKISLPDIERKTFISFLEQKDGSDWAAATGYFTGTFAEDLFGIKATGKSLFIRFTELAKIQDNKVVECCTFLDFVDVMNQLGVNPLRPSLGHDGFIMPPTSMDGLKENFGDKTEGKTSIALVDSMLEELGRYDGKALSSMKLENYWHNNFIWYGPAGVGTTRGIDGFRAHHQGPFLKGFPDRGIDKKFCFIANDNYAATGGWPHMYGTHTGDNWLGLNATGKTVYPRVMDIWRRENNLLVENWVAIDIPDMVHQMGLTLFDELLCD
ncbi:MAG: ester cyclase [Colwellia sp.]